MEPVTFKLVIQSIGQHELTGHVFNNAEENTLQFNISSNGMYFDHENSLSLSIRRNRHQLEKIIHSALKNDIQTGQTISCVFLENFTFLKDSDFQRFIRVDRLNNKLAITVNTMGFKKAYRIYADGSFNNDTKQSGYGGVIVPPDGKEELYCQSFNGGSSNLMELLAVTDGLQRLSHQKYIQVYSDSRFVIRGLTQWVHFWQHNNWQTAFARGVRYGSHWKKAFQLCEGKSVEFKWVKAHSGHVEHDFCHQLAKSYTCS